ncbi:MAG: ABC transporter ATP-binding protein [Caldilineaceae bacterium]
MFAIETRGLTRRYGQFMAVDDLNLQVPTGALFGLIGPNGAGKTTTLRMLAGLLEPSGGEILLNGQTAQADGKTFRQQIGYMPDFFGVYEDMLVWEYLDFFARCHSVPANRRRQITGELLDLVDLADKRDEYVESLSRGMRQRLCLAHALVHDPQILLLDEPASGLDPRARVEMRELLRELGAMGKTVVVSSHILAELAEMCDQVGIIQQGKLAASGPVSEIARRASAGRLLQITTLADWATIEGALITQPGIGRITEMVERNDQSDHPRLRIEAEFTGDDPAVANLLSALVSANIPILAFSETAGDLEEIFLQLTEP